MADEYIQVRDVGEGPAVAVDRVGDRNYQIVKIGVGSDNEQPAHVSAASPLPVAGRSVSKGYEQITAPGLTSLSPPSGARGVLISPTGEARIRDDGVAPTASTGFPVGVEGFVFDSAPTIGQLQIYLVSGVVDLWWFA